MQGNHPIVKRIQQSNYLPKIPKEFGETLTMLLEPYKFNMDECIEKLHNLPTLETTIIQILNFNSNLNREIHTLKDAVLYLGAKNTRMIAIIFITKLLLPNKKKRSKIFDKRKYWKHCIGVSIAGSMIAEKTGLCDKEKIFTYGLIHDIGVIVLDVCLPNHLDDIYLKQVEKGLHQIVAEKVVLNGLTHTEIGMWLCKEWGLSEEIIEVVGYHHTPYLLGKAGNEVKIMHLADCISTAYYESLIGTKKAIDYAEKMREELNLSRGFIESIAKKLPQEVEKISRTSFFEFY